MDLAETLFRHAKIFDVDGVRKDNDSEKKAEDAGNVVFSNANIVVF